MEFPILPWLTARLYDLVGEQPWVMRGLSAESSSKIRTVTCLLPTAYCILPSAFCLVSSGQSATAAGCVNSFSRGTTSLASSIIERRQLSTGSHSWPITSSVPKPPTSW